MLTSAATRGLTIVAWPESLDGWEHLGSWNCSVSNVPLMQTYYLDQANLTLTAAGVPAERQQVAFRELPSSPGMCWVECACRDSRKSDSPLEQARKLISMTDPYNVFSSDDRNSNRKDDSKPKE